MGRWWRRGDSRIARFDTNVGAGSPRPGACDNQTVGAGGPRPGLSDPEIEGGEPPQKIEGGETPPLRRATLGQVVGFFKYQSTKRINALRDNPGAPVWQRNYYERVIRDDHELDGIRQYIVDNPAKWEMDENHPARSGR